MDFLSTATVGLLAVVGLCSAAWVFGWVIDRVVPGRAERDLSGPVYIGFGMYAALITFVIVGGLYIIGELAREILER